MPKISIFSIFVIQESISLTILHNAQRCQHKVNAAKDAALFHWHFCWNFTAYFRLQLLHWVPYFGECSCHEKHRKLSAEMLLGFGAKNVGEIDPCMTYFHLAIWSELVQLKK
jgi:hypothetical protein